MGEPTERARPSDIRKMPYAGSRYWTMSGWIAPQAIDDSVSDPATMMLTACGLDSSVARSTWMAVEDAPDATSDNRYAISGVRLSQVPFWIAAAIVGAFDGRTPITTCVWPPALTSVAPPSIAVEPPAVGWRITNAAEGRSPDAAAVGA